MNQHEEDIGIGELILTMKVMLYLLDDHELFLSLHEMYIQNVEYKDSNYFLALCINNFMGNKRSKQKQQKSKEKNKTLETIHTNNSKSNESHIKRSISSPSSNENCTFCFAFIRYV